MSTPFFSRTSAEYLATAERLDNLTRRPLLSVVVPTYNALDTHLKACILSVLDQSYPDFELIVVDDGSKALMGAIRARTIAGDDSRVKVVERRMNGGISAATNDGIDAALGEFILLLDHDDELTSQALLTVAEFIVADPDKDVWYSDQSKCDDLGQDIDNFYKPDWSPIYMLGVMYVGHLLAIRADLCRRHRFLDRFNGVQDWEMLLRVSEETERIGHIPSVLYRWRASQGSLALGSNEKSGIDELHRRGVQDHLGRMGLTWNAVCHPSLPHRVILKPGVATRMPRISIIIPTRDQGEVVARCLDSIFAVTDYDDFEVVVVDNRTTDPIARKAFARYPIVRVPLDEPFNYSRANNAGVRAASGDLLVFLNNDTEVVSPDWLGDLALFLEDPHIGAVGPTLLYPNMTVQHAGVVLGSRGTADHVMRYLQEHSDGHGGSLACAREVSGVTAACLMLDRRLFDSLGGFNEDYVRHYQDVDLCLRIREQGLSIINAGYVRLVHHESLSRKVEGYELGDRALLLDRWHEMIVAGDPFYNVNLDLARLDYSKRHD